MAIKGTWTFSREKRKNKRKNILYLEYPSYTIQDKGANPHWFVRRIVNVTDIKPGDNLKKKTVNALCKSDEWEVHIKEKK